MTAEDVPLRSTFDPVRVEITSHGARGGRPFYAVDYVEADGCRAGMWHGSDLDEAHDAARECSEGGAMPMLDLTDAAHATAAEFDPLG